MSLVTFFAWLVENSKKPCTVVVASSDRSLQDLQWLHAFVGRYIHKIYASGGKWHASFVTSRNIVFYKALMSPDQWKPSDLHRAMELIVTSKLNSVPFKILAGENCSCVARCND